MSAWLAWFIALYHMFEGYSYRHIYVALGMGLVGFNKMRICYSVCRIFALDRLWCIGADEPLMSSGAWHSDISKWCCRSPILNPTDSNVLFTTQMGLNIWQTSPNFSFTSSSCLVVIEVIDWYILGVLGPLAVASDKCQMGDLILCRFCLFKFYISEWLHSVMQVFVGYLFLSN